VRFLLDTQLPAAMADWLRERSLEVEHVLEINLAQASDASVWKHATNVGAVIISKDEDFAEWVRRGRKGPSVVWIRIGNCSNRALKVRFESLLPSILAKLADGERLIEVR
jgi:predicted nuclease of predicted toxin-antitoxin system